MQKQTDAVLEPLVKQEQLDAEWGGSCANVYDALFEVVKHEVDDDTAVAGCLRDDDAANGGSVPRATTERQSTRDMVSRYIDIVACTGRCCAHDETALKPTACQVQSPWLT